jgi:predicted nucleotidyltransferase/plasmid maintenance system antidote protein VapI
MNETGDLIRELRIKKGYPLRKVAAFLDIDQAVLSKIERGQRNLKKDHIIKLAEFFEYDKNDLLIKFYSDKIAKEIKDEDLSKEILKVAEEKVDYITFNTLDRSTIINHIKNTLKEFSKIKKAWIYGSFARKDNNYKSDIDIAIEADKEFSYFDVAEVQFKLEEKVKRKIDIGFIDSFKPYIFKNIEKDLHLIYERQ